MPRSSANPSVSCRLAIMNVVLETPLSMDAGYDREPTESVFALHDTLVALHAVSSFHVERMHPVCASPPTSCF